MFAFRLAGQRPLTVLLAVCLSCLIFLSTLQRHINQSISPYVTDTGEIQNALPRWGTIHDNGYPLYTALGSAFVSLAQTVTISPATAAGLYSVLWAVIGVGLLAGFLLFLDVPPLIVLPMALLYAVSKSYWVDASIAEIHTMTMALSIATLWTAVVFGRTGHQQHLLLLAFLGGQILTHQRAFALFLPAIFILVAPHWRLILKQTPLCLLLGLLGPLTYLYLPWRVWRGADWVYGNPGTWQGLAHVIFYSRGDLIHLPQTAVDWLARARLIAGLISDDWPAGLMAVGLAGFALPNPALPSLQTRERLALTIGWLLHVPVCFMVWEGYISDALLAVKMPITLIAAIGLASLAHGLGQKRPLAIPVASLLGFVLAGFLLGQNRTAVLAITRANETSDWVSLAQEVPPPADGRSMPFVAFWGNAYWQVKYAQTFAGQFPHLTFIDHNHDWGIPLHQGQRVLTSKSLFVNRPPASWWQISQPVAFQLLTPDIVALQESPQITAVTPAPFFDFQNGLLATQADLQWQANGRLALHVQWQAAQNNLPDYSVEILVISSQPDQPMSGLRIQQAAPVDALYPTSHWQAGELVNDFYTFQPDKPPLTVRLSLFRIVAHETERTEWLTLPVPPQTGG